MVGSADLLKIDVQGAELLALRGCTRLLRSLSVSNQPLFALFVCAKCVCVLSVCVLSVCVLSVCVCLVSVCA